MIGDYPGFTEVKTGRVWSGKAGDVMDSMLWSAGLDRSDIFITNLLKYLPQVEGRVSQTEIKRDLPLLRIEYEGTSPSFVIALGRNPTRMFLGDVGLDAVHGIPFHVTHDDWRGAVTVIPCYSPAAGLHNTDLLAFAAYDLKQAALTVRGKLKARPVTLRGSAGTDYRRLRTVKEIQEALPFWDCDLYVDTEGYPDDPYCLTFTLMPGTGYMILAKDKALIEEFSRLIRERRIRVMMHNAMYDLGILKGMGVDLDGIAIGDTMVKAYELCLEPQGLKDLAFRHARMAMKSYDEVTQPYDWDIAIEYLMAVHDEQDWGEAPKLLVMEKGQFRVKQPQNLNRRVANILRDVANDKVDKDGNPVDPRKRWHEIPWQARAAAEREMGRMPRFTFRYMPEKEALDYACRDSDATSQIDPVLDKMIEANNLREIYEIDMSVIPILERMQSNGMLIKRGYFEELSIELFDKMEEVRAQIEEYGPSGEFLNPNSTDQMTLLLFDRLKLTPVKLTKKGRKPSTQAKALEALRHEHPVVPLIIQWREYANLRSKFAEVLPMYASLHDDYRVRGTIRATRVVTGRLSITRPPLQAIPTRTKEGSRIRAGFITPDGRKMGSADYNQIEMRYMAHLSEDERLCKLFNEGKDVHSITASMMFGVPVEQVDPKKHRYPAKRVGFGVITGIQDQGLYDQMRLAGVFDYTKDDCGRMIRDWFNIYPGVLRYMEWCRVQGRRYGFAQAEGGRRRYLPGIHSRVAHIREEAERQTHSFAIQAGAQTIAKRAMARLWGYLKHAWSQGYSIEPLLQVHDELIAEFAVNEEKEAEQMIRAAMLADAGKYRVPIDIGWGTGFTWEELK